MNWRVVMACLTLPLAAAPTRAESALSHAAGVSFLQAPEGAKQMTISLTVVQGESGRPASYLAHRSPQPLEAVASLPPSISDAYTGKDFSAFEIAAMPDGTRYVAVLNADHNVKFLNRNPSQIWFARIYRLAGGKDAHPKLLREGLQSSGNDVIIPVELELPGIGTTGLKSFQTQIGYSISGEMNGRPQVYSGRGSSLQVAGSRMSQGGKLTLTVTVPDELKVTPDTQVSLRFEPLDPGLASRTASGKVTDFLTLGSARLVVTALTPDFSSATLAVVKGSLEQSLKQQLQVGAEMPPFSQVNLLTRRTVTREAVLNKAQNGSGVIFVFGDLAPAAGRFGHAYPPYSIRGGNALLPLPPAEIVEQAGVALEHKPVVVFVTRQISINFLYHDLRNMTPDYLVLSDFVDPLQTTFRLPRNAPGPWYNSRPTGGNATLRTIFNLPSNALSIVAFNGTGKVLYVKTDVESKFLTSLTEARKVLTEQQTDGH